MSIFHRVSIQKIQKDIFNLWKRFPLVSLFSVIVTSSTVYLIEMERQWRNDNPMELVFEKWILISILAIFLFSFITIVLEKKKIKGIKNVLIRSLFILVIIGYYIYLPEDIGDMNVSQIYRHVFFHIFALLGLLIMPYCDKKALSFWRYGERLVVRFFITFVFTVTLYLGTILSLWSLDYLFRIIDFNDRIYFQTWIICVGIFALWFFMAKYPSKLYSRIQKFIYPTVLKVFVQYLLVPILTMFFIILYVYTGKIVFFWDWPLGGVAYWIIAYSTVALLAFILGYPMRRIREYAWIKKFFTALFVLIIPLSVVLQMAIWIRIDEYGITERRYLVVILGLWLVFVSLYYLISKKKKIHIIPISLLCVLLFSTFGPWGMFSISSWSQKRALTTVLEDSGLLEDGKLHYFEEKQKIDGKIIKSINSKIDYFESHGSIEKIEHFFPVDYEERMQYECKVNSRCYGKYIIGKRLLENLNIFSQYENSFIPNRQFINLYTCVNDINIPISVEGYNYLLDFSLYTGSDKNIVQEFEFSNSEKGTLSLEEDKFIFQIKRKEMLGLDMLNFVESVMKESNGYECIEQSEKLIAIVKGKTINIKVIFSSIGIDLKNRDKKESFVNNIKGTLLIDID
jgi:hypothetical protein